MHRRLTTWLPVAVACMLLPSTAVGQNRPAAPRPGAVVRVIVPRLDDEWQVGMFGVFDRVGLKPPCYVVSLFSDDGRYRLRERVFLAELDRLQAHRVYDDRFPLLEELQAVSGPEHWVDVPLDSLKRVNASNCPDTARAGWNERSVGVVQTARTAREASQASGSRPRFAPPLPACATLRRGASRVGERRGGQLGWVSTRGDNSG